MNLQLASNRGTVDVGRLPKANQYLLDLSWPWHLSLSRALPVVIPVVRWRGSGWLLARWLASAPYEVVSVRYGAEIRHKARSKGSTKHKAQQTQHHTRDMHKFRMGTEEAVRDGRSRPRASGSQQVANSKKQTTATRYKQQAQAKSRLRRPCSCC